MVKYIKSVSSNIAASGVVRFANNEGIGWRNAANGADKVLKLDAGDRLEIDGVDIVTVSSTDTLTNKTLTSPVINTPTGIVKGDVGLGNVDNTSDANKPVSTATQAALDLKAPLANPTFTGTVTGTFSGNLTGNVTGNTSGTAANVTGTVAIANGGTGQTSANAALNALLPSQTSNSGKVLQSDGSNTSWASVATAASPTFTGSIGVPDGSVTVPALAFTSDADGSGAGIYRVAANSLGFSANGVNVGQYSSAGAWTFGATTGSSLTHKFQSNGTTLVDVTTAAAAGVGIQVSRTVNTASSWQMYTPTGSTDLRFYSSADMGSVTAAGAWTLGPSGGTGSNLVVNGKVAPTVGVQFPATQSPSADANCLDDYEEGTWTPALAYDTPGTSSFGYASRSGKYTKVGNLVTLQGNLTLNSFSKGTATGNCRLGGLPFSPANATPVTIYISNQTFSSVPVSIIAAGQSSITFETLNSNSAGSALADPDSDSGFAVSVSFLV